MTSRRVFLDELSHLSLLFICQFYIKGSPVLLEILDLLGARDGNDIISLLPQPSQRELRGGAPLLVGQLLEAPRNLDILLPVAVLEAGQRDGAHVGAAAGVEVLAAGKGVGEDPPGKGHGDDEGHLELAAGGEEVVADGGLDVEVEGGVVGLDGGDGGDFDGAAEGVPADGGETDVLDFAFTA